MKNYVIINGVNSNTITGLMINELPPITKPQMRAIQEEIDGRDGDITTNLGYSAYDKTITIGLFGTGYDINNIISFFNGEGTIVFSNEDDKYYNFKILNQIDYVALQKFKSASITFHCQPFKYPLTETPLEIEYSYVSDEGETISLNTALGEMKVNLLGNTSQTGTPTPDNPIPVNIVSGDNEVVVCGKNILNNTATSLTYHNVTFTINEDKSITIDGTASANTNLLLDTISFESGKTYTISGITGYTDTTLQLYTASSSAFSTGNRLQCYNGAITRTAQANEICDVKLYVYSGVQYNNVKVYPMIVKGSTSGEYEPYQSSTYPINLPVKNYCSSVEKPANYNLKFFFNKDIPQTITISFTINEALSTNSLYLEVDGTSLGMAAQITASANTKATQTITFSDANYQAIQNGTTVDLLLYKNGANFTIPTDAMIEKGTKANSYTPYGTTPIELCKIGTYQDKFIRNSGKNLFDMATWVNSGNNSNYYSYSNGVLSINSVDARTMSTFIESDRIYLPNGTYYLSNIGNAGIRVYNDDTDANVVSTNEFEVTLGYIYLKLVSSSVMTCQPMLNEGSTALPYEPYGNGDWYLHKEIGKYTFTGNETPNSITGGYFYYDSSLGGMSYLIGGFNTKFQFINDDRINNNTSANEYLSDNQMAFRLGNYTKDRLYIKTQLSESDLKSAIANTPLYYVLQTPTYTKIEGTLKDELDEVYSAGSFEGTTNITQVNNDKAFILNVEAMEEGSNKVQVNNIGNTYAKPLLALEGTGNINIYLDNTQILQANVEDKMNIDIAKLEAYNPDTSVLLNRQVIGNYNSMTIPSGTSIIRMDGDLTKATITNYTRWL